jgi:uncharacterized protein YeaO (DUF488 family)
MNVTDQAFTFVMKKEVLTINQNKMKKRFYLLAVTMLLTAGTVITSCNMGNRQNRTNENIEDVQQRERIATAEEWAEFKSESERKIMENEARIQELKKKMMEPGVGLDSLRQNRIDRLEEKNNELRVKIRTYEHDKSDWESFKREFKHDMDEIGDAFKDLTIDNKK